MDDGMAAGIEMEEHALFGGDDQDEIGNFDF